MNDQLKKEPKNIMEAIQAIVAPMIKVQSFVGKVTSVDKDTDTCEVVPQEGGAERECRLTSVTNTGDGSKWVLYPKVGSFVTVSILNNLKEYCFVSQFFELDEVVINCNKITFNGGENGGLIKIDELVSRMNSIENALSALRNQYNSHTHLYSPGPSAQVPSATPIPVNQSGIGSTSKSALENPKIKH